MDCETPHYWTFNNVLLHHFSDFGEISFELYSISSGKSKVQ